MNTDGKTGELLINHCLKYPALKINDIFKFLFQSVFGCEHMVSSPDAAIEYIQREYDEVRSADDGVPEPLDGAYTRVPLSFLNRGLSAVTLGKLFSMSAKREETGLSDLNHKLQVAGKLIADGKLPFGQSEFDKALLLWKSKGYPSLHHSVEFREAYRPSYRVIANKYIPFLDFFAMVDKSLSHKRTIVAIDGGSAGGKTTLSHMLSELYDCTVFHMDDFFLQPWQRTSDRYAEIGGNIDYERFYDEVIKSLAEAETVCYRKFDCSVMDFGETIRVNPKKLIVAEGVYSMHPRFGNYCDLSLFMDIEPELQKTRIHRRNSPQLANRFFNEWIPLENKYFEKTNIRERTDMTVFVR